MIRVLSDRCCDLEVKLNYMRNKPRFRVNRCQLILSHIVPSLPFIEWARSIHILPTHLQCVFEYGLTEGIKMCLRDQLDSPDIPMHSIDQRTTMYIYDKTRVWKQLLCDDFNTCIHIITSAFMRAYLVTQFEPPVAKPAVKRAPDDDDDDEAAESDDELDKTPKLKPVTNLDTSVTDTQKISGVGVNVARQNVMLKKWLISRVPHTDTTAAPVVVP